MLLQLLRKEFYDDSTVGELYIDNELFCHTLEDKDRGLHYRMPLEDIIQQKVYGKTAIPKGYYKVINSYSPRFKKYLPLLLNVPGYSGVRIHNGNLPEHSLGCILVGQKPAINSPYKIINSKSTLSKLLSKLTAVEKDEEIIIEIMSDNSKGGV